MKYRLVFEVDTDEATANMFAAIGGGHIETLRVDNFSNVVEVNDYTNRGRIKLVRIEQKTFNGLGVGGSE